jgi:cytochrome c5
MWKSLGMVLVVVFIAAVMFSLSGFSSCAQSQQKQDPQSLVMTACSACHDTGRICDALGKKDKDAWGLTVTRMMGKGAAIDQESLPGVVDFLANLNPGSQPICK